MKTLAMFSLLLLVSQHTSGVPVQVYEGAESVLLPCQVPADISRNSTAVVWNRDEFTIPKVHMRKPNGDDLTNQNNRYTSRTSMTAHALQTGDLSLTLRNPTVSDSGTYTCNTRSFGQDLSQTEVQLKVSEPPPHWPIVVAVLVTVLLLLLLLAVLFGVYMHRAHKKVKKRAVYMLKPEVVKKGAESVRLPWRSGDPSPAVKAKWTREQPTHEEICECVKNQTGQWELQSGDHYKRSAQMDQLTNGDFSLTLKKPCSEDGGVYLCVVYGQDGKPLTVTIVALWVKETWETTFTDFFSCCMKETDEHKWRLSDALTKMLENSYGEQRLSEMMEMSDGIESVEETHLLNGQP